MGCASSAPSPQQNGTAKQSELNPHQQQHMHHLEPSPQQHMHHPEPSPQQHMHHPEPSPQQHMHHPEPSPQQHMHHSEPSPQQHMHYPEPSPQQHMHQTPPPQQAPPVPQQPVQGQSPPLAPSDTKQSCPPTADKEENANPAPVEINQALVDKMVELEQQVSELEKRNVIKHYELKADQVTRLTQQIQAMMTKQQELEGQTLKEYQDVVNLKTSASVHQMMTQVQFAQQMSKEQEEYMQALNRSEIHKKQLQANTRQLESLKQTMEPIRKESENLKELYDRQDSLLANIFSGKYGSEKEYMLESELDLLMEKKQRISVAKYKWTQSRTLIRHAVGQLGFAIRRWGEVIHVPIQSVQLRYSCAAEARNNLVAASQNIASAQSYLNTIKFPYCSPEEVITLNLAITHIFADLQTADRHKHAMECYLTVYRRSAALVQWFDQVINKTILKDNQNTVREFAVKQKELKLERLKLIKEKVRANVGDEAANSIQVADDKEEEEDDEPELATLSVIVADSDSLAGDLAESDKNPTNSEDTKVPTPLPLDKLAPAPNMDDIFGNVEQLKKQHQKQQNEYEKQQELSKARAEQGLLDKLAARRSRRRRAQAHEAEIQALTSRPPHPISGVIYSLGTVAYK